MGKYVYRIPQYVKKEIIKQAEKLGNYSIDCYFENYSEFVQREVWDIRLQTSKDFEFMPDLQVGNDWLDELYQLKSYVNECVFGGE